MRAFLQASNRHFREGLQRLPEVFAGEQPLNSFFVPAPTGLVILDQDLRVLRANDTMAEILGISPKEIDGQTPRMLVPQLVPIVEPMLCRVLSTGLLALTCPITDQTPKEPGVTRHGIVSVFRLNKSDFGRRCVVRVVVEVTDSVEFVQMKRSEAFLAEAEHLANVGSWEVDPLTDDGRWSRNLAQLLDRDASPMRFAEGEFWRLIHPDDRERLHTIIERAIEDGKPYEYQARFVLHDGRERVLLTRGGPVRDAPNRITKRVSVTQDITGRIRAEEVLRRSEERFRDLVENSRDLVYLHDLDGRLLWMNALPARILGYSLDILIGRRIPDLLEPDIRNQFDDYIQRIRLDGHAEGLMRVVARSGERRIWRYQNTLRTEGRQGPIVRGLAHDVTELVRAERANRLFRTLIDQSNDAFEVVDANTLRFLDVSERGCSDLGYAREELLNMTIFDVNPLQKPSDLPELTAEIRRLGSVTSETIHRRKDGSTFPVELSIKHVQLDKEYIVTVVRDITKRKRVEAALKRQEATVRGLFQIAQLLTQTLELPNIFDTLTLQSMASSGPRAGAPVCGGNRNCGLTVFSRAVNEGR